ncbi:MAG: hypothetical protein ACOVMM_04785 [Chitinophagaceae bacterium]
MTKKISFASLMAIALLMVLTVTNSTFSSASGQVEKLGAPFVFFTASDGGEIIDNQQFSMLAFLADLAICFVASMGILMLGSLFTVRKKTAVVA